LKFAFVTAFLPPLVCSLRENELSRQGGIAIAEALKINKTITNIRWGLPSPCYLASHCCRLFGINIVIIPIFLHLVYSLEDNNLGPEGGEAIAEALKINETIKDIMWGIHLCYHPFAFCYCLSVTAIWTFQIYYPLRLQLGIHQSRSRGRHRDRWGAQDQ
jgi:hypothetical protein